MNRAGGSPRIRMILSQSTSAARSYSQPSDATLSNSERGNFPPHEPVLIDGAQNETHEPPSDEGSESTPRDSIAASRKPPSDRKLRERLFGSLPRISMVSRPSYKGPTDQNLTRNASHCRPTWQSCNIANRPRSLVTW